MFDLEFPLVLAQDGSSAPIGGDTPVQPDGAAGGTGTPPSSGSPFGTAFLPLMLGLLVIMIIFSSLGPRRERKKREAMLNVIKKHDRVQTVGGVIGAIVELKPDFVVLKVDESANTRITFARSAIQQVLTSSDDKDASSTG